MLSKQLDNGLFYIFDDVIKLITKIAISEVSDVHCRLFFVENKLMKTIQSHYRNIKVNSENNEVIVDLTVGVVYGAQIPIIIKELQSLIKMNIELFTGFRVKAINVTVDQLIINE